MKVLVVDDEVDLVELLKSVIEGQGHTVDMAFDGQKGLELLQENCYDIAFLDHNMPELTGVELLKHIRKNHLNIRTVIMSGYEGMNSFFVKIEGADEYISKPFNDEVILEILNKYDA